ncbi:Uncharacterized protein PBTT_00660 [Plasmodiophora brassicae]
MDAAEHVLEEQAGGERQKSKSVAYDLRFDDRPFRSPSRFAGAKPFSPKRPDNGPDANRRPASPHMVNLRLSPRSGNPNVLLFPDTPEHTNEELVHFASEGENVGEIAEISSPLQCACVAPVIGLATFGAGDDGKHIQICPDGIDNGTIVISTVVGVNVHVQDGRTLSNRFDVVDSLGGIFVFEGGCSRQCWSWCESVRDTTSLRVPASVPASVINIVERSTAMIAPR